MQNIFILIFIFIVSIAFALEPKHDCTQPAIPLKFHNNAEIRSFNAATDIYKLCIDKFISDHRINIDNDIASIKSASSDWSNFVKLTQKSSAYQQHVIPPTISPVQGKTGPAPFGPHNVGHNDPTTFSTSIKF